MLKLDLLRKASAWAKWSAAMDCDSASKRMRRRNLGFRLRTQRSYRVAWPFRAQIDSDFKDSPKVSVPLRVRRLASAASH